MGGRGRPLRFLGGVTVGWVGLRVAMLWPQLDSAEAVLRAVAPIPIAAAAQSPVAAPRNTPSSAASVSPQWRAAVARLPVAGPGRGADPMRVALALLGLVRYGDADVSEGDAPLLPGLPRPIAVLTPATKPLPSRWSASLWLVARDGVGIAPGVGGGQLGGSQAGMRIAYTIDRRRRIALAGRVTSPLGSGLREAALGVEWQPTRVPVRIVAEERIAIDGGRSGPAIGLVGGVGPVALPLGFRLEAYGQAGVIRRSDTEPYADGAARMAHPVATLGAVRIDLGAGVWAGAQRGAARVDVGPSLSVTAPLAKHPVRLTLDWRERVAGNARPGSGPALTLGTDF